MVDIGILDVVKAKDKLITKQMNKIERLENRLKLADKLIKGISENSNPVYLYKEKQKYLDAK